MKNKLQVGDVMDYTAPAGGVVSGNGYLIGALFVIATSTAAAGVKFAGDTEGVFTLPKTLNEGALIEGQPVYWDVANAKFSIDSSLGLNIGTVAAAALTGDATASIRLHGMSLAGRLLTVRKRFAIATINAGATNLVPAVPGLKARMVAASAIAVGGAAGAVTTVDILATQAAGSVKLVAFAQASLLQSAKLTDGGAGAAILADGASYVANDVNTAIQVSKTGAAITTATFIDVAFSYVLEA